ncbi:MAG: cytochrome c biogenesis protein CcsA [Candidatus Kapaibacterium sp.]
MLALARICEAILPLAYSAAFAIYALAFFRKEEGAARWRRPALVAALLIHTALIYAQTMYHGHCLVYTPFEMLTLISFTITLTYLIVELASGERGTGMFFVGLALLLQTISIMFSPSVEDQSANPVLLNDAVGLHISAALIGYTAFAISAVYGGLYLMLYHQIKSNRFGTFYQRLPSLQLLERMSEKSSIVGVAFLAVAIAIGLIYLPGVLPNFHYYDPKLIVTIAIWGIYASALLAKYVIKLEGRKVVILSLVGFLGTIISMTLINFVLSGFHRFQ